MEEYPWSLYRKSPSMPPFLGRGKDNRETSPHPGDKQPSMMQGGRGAAREGSPDIPRQQRRTLPTAVRERDRSSRASMPRALPKGTPLSAHQAHSPRHVTAWARTLLPLPRRSLRAHTAPGSAHPLSGGGSRTTGSAHTPTSREPTAGHSSTAASGSRGPRSSLALSRRRQESTGWPDRDQQAPGWEPEPGVSLAHEQDCL